MVFFSCDYNNKIIYYLHFYRPGTAILIAKGFMNTEPTNQSVSVQDSAGRSVYTITYSDSSAAALFNGSEGYIDIFSR